MIKPGNRFGFPLEEAQRICGASTMRIGSHIGSTDFDRDLLTDASIFRQIDFTHASAAEQAQQSILPELHTF